MYNTLVEVVPRPLAPSNISAWIRAWKMKQQKGTELVGLLYFQNYPVSAVLFVSREC